MIIKRSNKRQYCNCRGFSLTEVMITSAIAACLMTGISLVFGVIGKNLKNQNTTISRVNIGHNVLKNYYDIESSSINTYSAPSYGRAATADRLKSRFYEDITDSSGVFCLAREGLNTLRPAYIPLDLNIDARVLDSPESFRLHLAKVMTQSQEVFIPWRGVSNSSNGSIFILSSSGFEGFIGVRAIYDIDFHQSESPVGTYASVKRYAWNSLTDYYDVFYPDNINDESFSSVFAFHERKIRRVILEGDMDNYKNAEEMPFYFIWWPDPSSNHFQSQSSMASITEAKINYGQLASQTNYFFTVPLFPSF